MPEIKIIWGRLATVVARLWLAARLALRGPAGPRAHPADAACHTRPAYVTHQPHRGEPYYRWRTEDGRIVEAYESSPEGRSILDGYLSDISDALDRRPEPEN